MTISVTFNVASETTNLKLQKLKKGTDYAFFFPSHMKLKKPQIHDNETPRQKSVNSITTNQPSQLTAFLPSWAEPHR